MQSADTDAIDQLAASWDCADSPGCAVGVVRGGDLVVARGYGIANLEDGMRISASSVFHLASASKQFTAAAIARLARDGRLSVEDDIREYVPEVPRFGTPITIRHLLLHTGGLGDQWDVLALAGWRPADSKSNYDVLDLISRQQETESRAGHVFAYSNVGYTLLALIVERASGWTFSRYTHTMLFEPLGMTSSRFEDDPADVVHERARGYVRASGGRYQTAAPTYTVGASGLLSTVEDVARWIGELRDAQVFGREFVQRLMTPGMLDDGTPLTYAYGLFVDRYRGFPSVSHAGGEAGYRAFLLWLPACDLGVIVLANTGIIDVETLGFRVADLYLGIDGAGASGAATPAKAREVDTADLSRLAGVYRNPERGASLAVLLEEDTLYIEPRLELEPLENGSFALLTTPVEIRFSAGASASLILEELFSGHPFARYERVAPCPIPSERMAEYEGAYYSDELDTIYHVHLDNDKLRLRRKRFPEGTLTVAAPDEFNLEYGITLHFRRDARGAVDGFIVPTRSGRAIRFGKR
jgi:CubicO group peptidase (beta-lactamase class C family)